MREGAGKGIVWDPQKRIQFPALQILGAPAFPGLQSFLHLPDPGSSDLLDSFLHFRSLGVILAPLGGSPKGSWQAALISVSIRAHCGLGGYGECLGWGIMYLSISAQAAQEACMNLRGKLGTTAPTCWQLSLPTEVCSAPQESCLCSPCPHEQVLFLAISSSSNCSKLKDCLS